MGQSAGISALYLIRRPVWALSWPYTRCLLALLFLAATLTGCTGKFGEARPGPDKQGYGLLEGAVSGAGSGAVTGFQLGAGTGPGAAVGAGLGAVAGSLRGMAQDSAEDQLLDVAAGTRVERQRAVVHEVLYEHYKRRLELHPDRDIFPADLFFYGDESKLRPDAVPIVTELAKLNKTRFPGSRLMVVVYSKVTPHNVILDGPPVVGDDGKEVVQIHGPDYGEYLTTQRSKEIVNYLVRAGIEPRRLVAKGVMVDKPILVDPTDSPYRYYNAVELIPLDR